MRVRALGVNSFLKCRHFLEDPALAKSPVRASCLPRLRRWNDSLKPFKVKSIMSHGQMRGIRISVH
jgi:hypothetical protein